MPTGTPQPTRSPVRQVIVGHVESGVVLERH
jgi:hypothetical protein